MAVLLNSKAAKSVLRLTETNFVEWVSLHYTTISMGTQLRSKANSEPKQQAGEQKALLDHARNYM
jgi:hypothetical protein